jgi:hypothetical protein
MTVAVNVLWFCLSLILTLGITTFQYSKSYYKWSLLSFIILILISVSEVNDIANEVYSMTDCLDHNANFSLATCRFTVTGMWICNTFIVLLLYTGPEVAKVSSTYCFAKYYVYKGKFKDQRSHGTLIRYWFGCFSVIFYILEQITRYILTIIQIIGLLHVIAWLSVYNTKYVHNDSLDLFWIWILPMYFVIIYVEYKAHVIFEWKYVNIAVSAVNVMIFIATINREISVSVWVYCYLILAWLIQYAFTFHGEAHRGTIKRETANANSNGVIVGTSVNGFMEIAIGKINAFRSHFTASPRDNSSSLYGPENENIIEEPSKKNSHNTIGEFDEVNESMPTIDDEVRLVDIAVLDSNKDMP